MKENYILYYNLALRGLNTLENLLGKAKIFATESNLEEMEILESRLAPDMFNFTRQVQIYTDGVVGVVYRLAGQEKPSMPDVEMSLDELLGRVQNARELLNKISLENINFAEMLTRKISLPWMKGSYFEATEYLQNYAFLNSIFHLTTAYDILRMQGIQIGKMDFLGKLGMKS